MLRNKLTKPTTTTTPNTTTTTTTVNKDSIGNKNTTINVQPIGVVKKPIGTGGLGVNLVATKNLASMANNDNTNK
jgi:hypothetical protein